LSCSAWPEARSDCFATSRIDLALQRRGNALEVSPTQLLVDRKRDGHAAPAADSRIAGGVERRMRVRPHVHRHDALPGESRNQSELVVRFDWEHERRRAVRQNVEWCRDDLRRGAEETFVVRPPELGDLASRESRK
jgi:hypothetical protein